MPGTMCNHVALLHLAGRGPTELQDTGRYGRLLSELGNPHRKYPRTVHFVGRRAKENALRHLFPTNNIRRVRPLGVANLRADTATLRSDSPLLFSDSDISPVVLSAPSNNKCHADICLPIEWSVEDDGLTLDLLQARLFFLFADIVCLFADDFRNLENVAHQVVRWVRAGSASSFPRHLRPRLLVVMSDETIDKATHELQIEDFRHDVLTQSHEDLQECFSAVKTLYLGSTELSSLTRYRQLKEHIGNHLKEIECLKRKEKVLFSAPHQAQFWSDAVRHFSRTKDQPFDCIKSSRRGVEINEDFVGHICNFITECSRLKTSYETAASHIASALLMDAYAPRMHVFEPHMLFDAVYRNICFSACVQAGLPLTLADFECNKISESLGFFFTTMTHAGFLSTDIHRDNMERHSLQWKHMRSNLTCLSCLRRRPEHGISCGHSICDNCVRIFGSRDNETQFRLAPCLLCSGTGSVVAVLKPPTAGVRILSIDGGGPRGIIPLEHLNLLQNVIGPCPIGELFDFTIGTSSGGLIVLGLSTGQSVETCRDTFSRVAKKCFGRKWSFNSSFFGRIGAAIRCWQSDGAYEASVLESCLKSEFGASPKLFGRPSRAKVAVVATSISNATPFLFANYNGVWNREKTCGYKLVRPSSFENEPHIWQVGMATAAAPGFYKTVEIPGIGSFQDGALGYNNPIRLALQECKSIWPGFCSPDVVVSLGTGTEKTTESPKAPRFRHVMYDGFVPRLFRHLMASMDGENAWAEVWNSLADSEKATYFRLNLPLKNVPAIDDVDSMDVLQSSVHQSMESLKNEAAIAEALAASNLFFCLDAMPTYQDGVYICKGFIRCRIESYTAANIFTHLGYGPFRFEIDSLFLDTCRFEDDICPVCHRYGKEITFRVRRLDDVVSIFLRHGRSRRMISAFPQSMDWFIAEQHLDTAFGLPDHGMPYGRRCAFCDEPGMKRKRGPHKHGNRRKRPRLSVQVR